jgi:hypothetical protein
MGIWEMGIRGTGIVPVFDGLHVHIYICIPWQASAHQSTLLLAVPMNVKKLVAQEGVADPVSCRHAIWHSPTWRFRYDVSDTTFRIRRFRYNVSNMTFQIRRFIKATFWKLDCSWATLIITTWAGLRLLN